MPNSNPPKPLRAVPPPTLTGGKQVGNSQVAGGPTQYDARNFYIAATDQDKQKSTMRLENGRTLAFPPYIVAQVSALVEDELTPYRYAHDFIRDAVVHRLHYLQEHKDDSDLWGAGWEMAQIERAISDANRQISQVERVSQALEFAVDTQNPNLYDRTLRAARTMLPSMESPHKEKLDALLKKYARP